MCRVERDSDERWFQMGVAISYVNQGHGPRKESYRFSVGTSNDLRRRSEEVDSMPIAEYPQVDSTSDVVYSRRREPESVVDLHFEMMGSMGDVYSRREEFCQGGVLSGRILFQSVSRPVVTRDNVASDKLEGELRS